MRCEVRQRVSEWIEREKFYTFYVLLLIQAYYDYDIWRWHEQVNIFYWTADLPSARWHAALLRALCFDWKTEMWSIEVNIIPPD